LIVESVTVGGVHSVTPVGFQNLGTVSDQRFQAAASYWLIRLPRIARRRILPRIGSGTGTSARHHQRVFDLGGGEQEDGLVARRKGWVVQGCRGVGPRRRRSRELILPRLRYRRDRAG
jgi:hypothetical protein